MQHDLVFRQYDKKYVLWGLLDDPLTPNPEDWKDKSSYYPQRWVPLGVYDHVLEPVETKK